MAFISTLHPVSAEDLNKVSKMVQANEQIGLNHLTSLRSFDINGVEINEAWEDFDNFFKEKDPVKINLGKIFDKAIVSENENYNVVAPEEVMDNLIMLASYTPEEIVDTINYIHSKDETDIFSLEPSKIYTTEDDIDFLISNYRNLYRCFNQAKKEGKGIIVRITKT